MSKTREFLVYTNNKGKPINAGTFVPDPTYCGWPKEQTFHVIEKSAYERSQEALLNMQFLAGKLKDFLEKGWTMDDEDIEYFDLIMDKYAIKWTAEEIAAADKEAKRLKAALIDRNVHVQVEPAACVKCGDTKPTQYNLSAWWCKNCFEKMIGKESQHQVSSVNPKKGDQ